MGHRTLLGAGTGCLIGHHEANKAARDEAARNEREDTAQEREYDDLRAKHLGVTRPASRVFVSVVGSKVNRDDDPVLPNSKPT